MRFQDILGHRDHLRYTERRKSVSRIQRQWQTACRGRIAWDVKNNHKAYQIYVQSRAVFRKAIGELKNRQGIRSIDLQEEYDCLLEFFRLYIGGIKGSMDKH